METRTEKSGTCNGKRRDKKKVKMKKGCYRTRYIYDSIYLST